MWDNLVKLPDLLHMVIEKLCFHPSEGKHPLGSVLLDRASFRWYLTACPLL